MFHVTLSTDKGQQITVALTASGVPFKGRYDKESIFFDYDGDYKESVDEIIAKFTSDDYAVQRNEIAEHKGDVEQVEMLHDLLDIQSAVTAEKVRSSYKEGFKDGVRLMQGVQNYIIVNRDMLSNGNCSVLLRIPQS